MVVPASQRRNKQDGMEEFLQEMSPNKSFICQFSDTRSHTRDISCSEAICTSCICMVDFSCIRKTYIQVLLHGKIWVQLDRLNSPASETKCASNQISPYVVGISLCQRAMTDVHAAPCSLHAVLNQGSSQGSPRPPQTSRSSLSRGRPLH